VNLDACLWALDVPVEPGPKLVLLTLAVHANSKLEAWPTLPALARETGFSVSTVQRHLAVLGSRGLISSTRRPGRSTVRIVGGQWHPGHSYDRHPGHSYDLTGPVTAMTDRSKQLKLARRARPSPNDHPVASDSFAEDTFLKGTGWVRDTRRRRRPRS